MPLDAHEPLLFDDCDRCVEHSHDLLTLDGVFIGALWRKMIAVERRDEGHYRSDAERRACVTLYNMAVLLERNTVRLGVWDEDFLGAPD